MITRTNQILSLALIVQIVIGIVLVMPGDSETSSAAGPLLAEFAPDEVVSLTIQDGDDNTLALQKTDQDEWVLPDKGDYPVRSTSVQQLLDKLGEVNRNRLIAQNQSSQKRLGVSKDEYERRIEIGFANDKTQTIYLGASAGTTNAYIRLDGENDIYLTNDLASWEISARMFSWIDTTYFSIPSKDIVLLQIENANGVFQLQKTGDEWTLVGLADDETFNADSVTSLLSKVSTIRLTVPLGKEADPTWNMDDPTATITITVAEEVAPSDATSAETSADTSIPGVDSLLTDTPDETATATPETEASDETEAAAPEIIERTYELRFGQPLENSTYPLISSESEFYVEVSTPTAEAFVNLTRADLLVAQPEATEEAVTPDATVTPQRDED